MNRRIQKLRLLFKEKNVHAFLVTQDQNVSYLTHYPCRESWLLVTRQKAYFLTDFRYLNEAKTNLKGFSVQTLPHSLPERILKITKRHGIKRIGFDERHLSLWGFKKLKEKAGKHLKWVALNEIVEDIRVVKSSDEIRIIKQAIKINLEMFRFIKKGLKPGLCETDILDQLRGFCSARKVTFSFEPIVASGPNSCMPHARVSRRKIKKNEPVLIDAGIDVKGYKSDLTRMFFLGKIPQFAQGIYAAIVDAQQSAIAKIRPGVLAKDIDQQARKCLKKNKLDRYFGHSLGHGVGLEIHESPTISSQSLAVLREGMIITVEPGVYLPGKFGMRREDMVLVTKKGYQVLSDNLD